MRQINNDKSVCVRVISTPRRNKSLKTAECGRCISRCKLSWPPGEWPVKRCLCGQSPRGGDDMSVSKDRFLSAFSVSIDQRPKNFVNVSLYRLSDCRASRSVFLSHRLLTVLLEHFIYDASKFQIARDDWMSTPTACRAANQDDR